MKALFSSITSVSTGVPAETRTAAYDWSAPAGEPDQFGYAGRLGHHLAGELATVKYALSPVDRPGYLSP